MARVDYDKQSVVYDQGRDLPPEAIAAWMVAARRHVSGDVERVLDLGSGTGRFSAALAETFDADVVGVEPSAGMLGHAANKPHPKVRLVRGAAEHLPLEEATCDLAWLSNVFHHFDDPQAAACELRRVVAPNGTVLVRGAFHGLEECSLYRFFPEAKRVIDSFPDATESIGCFEQAGFGSFYIGQVRQLTSPSLAESYERMKLRADTALEKLTDEEFERGLGALEEASRVEDGPVFDALTLIVVR